MNEAPPACGRLAKAGTVGSCDRSKHTASDRGAGNAGDAAQLCLGWLACAVDLASYSGEGGMAGVG
jgi:hypothetical protein